MKYFHPTFPLTLLTHTSYSLSLPSTLTPYPCSHFLLSLYPYSPYLSLLFFSLYPSIHSFLASSLLFSLSLSLSLSSASLVLPSSLSIHFSIHLCSGSVFLCVSSLVALFSFCAIPFLHKAHPKNLIALFLRLYCASLVRRVFFFSVAEIAPKRLEALYCVFCS